MRPSRAQLEAARDRLLPDVIAPDLRVVFCGINPSLYSAAVGHHFARPGNRFWPALHGAGWTDRRLDPTEDRELLRCGCGLTNTVTRSTARADELTAEEIMAGADRLRRTVARYRPRCIAFLGLGAFGIAFGVTGRRPGPQPERIGKASLWALPNPSGLNAHYQLPDFVALFRALRIGVR